jgi:DNA invertase Pin-like site-specific DNA recombinase/predicted nucleotidyltransferase
MTIFGYARVSTDGQTLDAQLEALKAAGCDKVFREKVSGANADRAELTRLLATIDQGDTMIVSRLDRLARSTRDLLNILDTLAQRGATFRSLGDGWADTTTPHGRLMLTVLGGLAEFERELIRLRTGEGRTRAKARGVHMGRPPKLTAHQRREALQALANGEATQADLVRRFNVSQSTISRLADKAAVLPSSEPVISNPRIDAATEHAARVFMQRLEGKFAAIEGRLFGSRARGTHKPDSDADIAVILQGEQGDRYGVSRDMAGIAFDVMMETGVLIDALPLWEDELKRPERFSNPALIESINRDGLRL